MAAAGQRGRRGERLSPRRSGKRGWPDDHGRDPNPDRDHSAAAGRVPAGRHRPAVLAQHPPDATGLYSRHHSRDLGHPAQMSSRSTEYLGPVSDARAVQRLERLARLLDSEFRVPGTRFRFGLDGLVGFIPGIGDAAGLAISSYIVVEAWRLGAPSPILLRMIANLVVDGAVGAVPIAGDLFDIAWKANKRNMNLLLGLVRKRP